MILQMKKIKIGLDLKKQENIIKEVIEDIDKLNNYSTEYPLSEKVILTYNDYLKENIKN
jgi:hypothetical protein